MLFSTALAHANTITLPAHEQRIISEVADEYGLSGDSRLLLFVIRRVENGGKGREMGAINPRAINTTFRNQCQWAAGTIAKRYTGDLKKFGLRWCPIITENINWYKNAKHYMEKWK